MATIELARARVAPAADGTGWLARGPVAVVWSPDQSAATGQLLSSWLSIGPEELLACLAGALADPSARAWPPLAAVVARGQALVVVVHGPVEVVVGHDGHEEALRGGDEKGSWLSRTFEQAGQLRALAAGARTGPGAQEPAAQVAAAEAGDDLVNLAAGLVRAGGFTAYFEGDGAGGEVVEVGAQTGGDAGAQTGGDAGPSPAATAPPEGRADMFDQEATAGPSIEDVGPAAAPARPAAFPAEVGVAAGPRVAAVSSRANAARGSVMAGPRPEDATVMDAASVGDVTLVERVASGAGGPAGTVRGVYCPNGHFNDPRLRACRRCGARLAPGAPQVDGPRPALGFLTWDDGEVSPLGPGALVGREVAMDDEVAVGRLSPVVPSGTNDSMSRVHAELRAVGWEVTIADRGSTNGTFVWDEVTKTWQRLVPGEPQVVAPGTVLAFGERTATFDA